MKRKTTCLHRAALALLAACSLPHAHAQEADELYLVYMNPFMVEEHEQMARNMGYSRPTIPPMIRPEAQVTYVMNNLAEFAYSPGVENARRELARDLNLRDAGRSLVQTPAFFARLNQNEVKALLLSERVVTVDKINPNAHVGFSAPADYTVGGEIIPWGKQAIGTDDNLTASNVFYIVDLPYHIMPALGDELNVIHTSTTANDPFYTHSTSILSVAAARSNNSKTRGINPGQPIFHLAINHKFNNIAELITSISAMSEIIGDFSTINLSINTLLHDGFTPITENNFDYHTPIGHAIRRASARLLFTQSAGNYNVNACTKAYNPSQGKAQPDDGIMVVGGTDSTGARYQKTANPSFDDFINNTEDRSNYGPCVDIWAPGQLMTAPYFNQSNATYLSNITIGQLTGTSFSAPLVAAVSGRYGPNWRPIQREAQIRQSARLTGHREGAPDSNLPIMQVHYSPNVIASTPKLLPIYGIYSETHTANLHTLSNSKFYEDSFWNAHGHYGTVVLDLGSPQNLKGVRLMIRSSAKGGVLNFAVHGANQITHTGPGQARIGHNIIGTKLTNDQFDLIPYYIPVNGRYRYISVDAANLNSWVAFSEIEVYGQ